MPPKELSDASCSKRQLAEALRHTMTGGNLQQLLRHSDRNSMHWSIESRVPFLTNDLGDYVLSLPEDFLVSKDGEPKYLLREALRGLVPNSIRCRKDKIGFATPETEWLKQIGPLAMDWHEACSKIPFMDAEKVRRIFVQELAEEGVPSKHTWRLINLCGWMSTVVKA